MLTCTVIVASVTILAAGLGLTAWWIDRPEKPHHKPVALKRALRHLAARKPTTGWGALRRPLDAADTRTLNWVRVLTRPLEAARVQGLVLAWLIAQGHAHHEDAHPLPGPMPAPTDAGPGEYRLYADDTAWHNFTALKEVV